MSYLIMQCNYAIMHSFNPQELYECMFALALRNCIIRRHRKIFKVGGLNIQLVKLYNHAHFCTIEVAITSFSVKEGTVSQVE